MEERKNGFFRGAVAEAIKAEYGSSTGRANMVLSMLYVAFVIALAIPKSLEVVADAVLRAFNKEQLKDLIVPNWVLLMLVILVPITSGICLYIVYKMSEDSKS